MGKLWKKIKHDCQGAVTVMVTLLLIPAVLISGTGVDLARLYTAKSIVQDGNQLAANAALTNYDALLQDLYGLYGMMTKDPAFADLMDQYIKVAVLGDGTVEKGLGTFQLFSGSNLSGGDVTPIPNQNLANPEVLRRQIEEYAKFRAPVVIVNEIMGTLDALEKVKADAQVIKQKMDIDDKIDEIDKIYRKIYDCINKINDGQQREESACEAVNALLSQIEAEISSTSYAREAYNDNMDSGNEDMANDWEAAYDGHVSNIKSLVNGGTVHEGWIPGYYDENGEFISGYWMSSHQSTGLKKVIGDNKKALEDYISNATWEDDSLAELVSICEDAETKKTELKQMLDNLERELSKGECSKELSEGLTKKVDGKSVIDEYRALLKGNLPAMAKAMQNADKPQLQANIDQLDSVGYGNRNLGTDYFYSPSGLVSAIQSSSINYTIGNVNPNEVASDELLKLSRLASHEVYEVLGTYKKFQDCGTENKDFYEQLCKLYGGTTETNKKSFKSNILKVIKMIQDSLSDIFLYEPEGAYAFYNERAMAAPASSDDSNNFGSSGNWEDTSTVKNALSDSLLTRLKLQGDETVNKILLMTYTTEMFSCYSTGKQGEIRSEDGNRVTTVEKNMNGIPLGIDVNYFYQSELEYIFHGNRSDAIDNLKSLAGMILLVRFVFNYVSSFTVPSVKETVATVKSALSAIGPFGVAIGELVRLAMALGESAMDLGRLKNGSKVMLYKTQDYKAGSQDGWHFSLSGILSATTGALQSSSIDTSKDTGSDSTGFTLTYKDYVRLILLLVDGDTMAQRTANLIEMNVTNKKANIGAIADRAEREAAMTKADMFLMREAVTDISVTTNVELKMIFLSMPFSQKGVNGVVPPGTLPLTVTDYRGY